MDIDMPNLDGLTATKTILHAYPKAKIIVLLEDTDKYYQSVAKAIGANAVASKDNLLKVRSMIDA